MKNFNKQNGITLVALVVTIIVLLILAGVSLSLVAGENGILGRATRAVDNTLDAEAKEEAALLISDTVAEFYEEKYVKRTLEVQTQSVTAYLTTSLVNKATQSGKYTVTVTEGTDGIKVYKKDDNATPLATGEINENGGISWKGTTNTPESNPSTGTGD